MKHIYPAIMIFLSLTTLTGLIYPLAISGVGHVLFPNQAEGEIIKRQGRAIGARRIAQKFVGAHYFWGRPSSIDYNPLPSGGSNLGPTSEALKKVVAERAAVMRQAHALSDQDATALVGAEVIPQDLLFASASGLDPDISPEAAFFQASRVAKVRGVAIDQIRDLVAKQIVEPDLGFIGEPTVNVLELNLALDEMTGVRK